MEFFGISFENLLLILFIGLIIFGPERLPQIAGQIGRWIGEFRRMSTEVRQEVSQELALNEFSKLKTEMTEIAAETRKELTDLKTEVAEIASDTRKELTGVTPSLPYEQSFYSVTDNNASNNESSKTDTINAAVEATPVTASGTPLSASEIADPTVMVGLDSVAAPAAAIVSSSPAISWRSALGRPRPTAPTSSNGATDSTAIPSVTESVASVPVSNVSTVPNYNYSQDLYFGKKPDTNKNGTNGIHPEVESISEVKQNEEV